LTKIIQLKPKNYNMKKAFLLRLLAAILVLTATTVTIQKITGYSTANAAADGSGGVWNSQVISNLNSYGYTGVSILSIDASGTRTCSSTNHVGYSTIVYVLNGMIVGHEDVANAR
jgi:hypothetical protein